MPARVGSPAAAHYPVIEVWPGTKPCPVHLQTVWARPVGQQSAFMGAYQYSVVAMCPAVSMWLTAISAARPAAIAWPERYRPRETGDRTALRPMRMTKIVIRQEPNCALPPG